MIIRNDAGTRAQLPSPSPSRTIDPREHQNFPTALHLMANGTRGHTSPLNKSIGQIGKTIINPQVNNQSNNSNKQKDKKIETIQNFIQYSKNTSQNFKRNRNKTQAIVKMSKAKVNQ